MNPYVVLLGDVEDSRKVPDREQAGERIRRACTALSARYQASLLAPLEVLKGVDEVGGVLREPDVVYDIASRLRSALLPQRIRLVAVRGEIDSGLGRGTVSEMDGAAFHRGNELMLELKGSGMPFAIDYGDRDLDEVLSGLAGLVWLMREGRTETQQRAVEAYERLGTQAAAGLELGTTQQNISKRLEDAHYDALLGLEDRIRRALSGYRSRWEGE